MRKGILIRQHDITDCGAACLASISAYYNLHIPISKIRQFASTDKKGTNILGMIEAAEKLNFEAKGVKSINDDGTVKIEPLFKIPKPAIAHIIVKGNLQHFVVIYKVQKSYIEIMDPGTGTMIRKSIDEFSNEWTGVLVLLVPNDEFTARKEKVSIIKRFWFLLKPYKRVLFEALFGAVIYTILGLTTSIYLQKVIDYVIPNSNQNLLNLLSIVMIIILCVSLFINYVKNLFMIRVGIQIDARLILGYYKHLLRLPQSFYDTMRSGEIISRLNDAVKIRSFINETLIALTVNVFTVLFAFALMFTYYWKLAVIMLIVIPLYIVIYLLYDKVNKLVQRRLMEDAAELQAQLVESINTASTIKRFGLEEYSDIKTETRFIKFMRTGYTSVINSITVDTSADFVSRLFTIILLWVGAGFVFDLSITSGELMSFYALIGYFINPITSIVNINRTYQDAKIAADRLFEIMDLDTESTRDKIPLTKENCGDIEFRNVSFRYGTRIDVFKDFNVTFAKGRVHAIVGESGSGKSTLAALIQNLYPLKKGQIYIGSLDIQHIDNSDLRRLVCVVPQRIDLFEGTILENIVLDDYDPDMRKVLEISQQVGILDFVEQLSAGFNTNIGENGMQLSGGQRQRLAIARALFKDPAILILDEATSALDSESELHIKRIVNNLKESGKTVILIAHRLGTVMSADRIYVLKDGELIEEGTHHELLENNSHYSKFWKSQTELK